MNWKRTAFWVYYLAAYSFLAGLAWTAYGRRHAGHERYVKRTSYMTYVDTIRGPDPWLRSLAAGVWWIYLPLTYFEDES